MTNNCEKTMNNCKFFGQIFYNYYQQLFWDRVIKDYYPKYCLVYQLIYRYKYSSQDTEARNVKNVIFAVKKPSDL